MTALAIHTDGTSHTVAPANPEPELLRRAIGHVRLPAQRRAGNSSASRSFVTFKSNNRTSGEDTTMRRTSRQTDYNPSETTTRRSLRGSAARTVGWPRPHKEVAEIAQECVFLAFPDNAAKLIAKAGNIRPKGGEKIVQGENGMSLGTFVNAWHSDPQFRAAAKMLLLMEQDSDPEMQRFMAAAMQAYAKVRGG